MGVKWTIVSLLWTICIHCINTQSIECHGNCICSPSITGRLCILNCNEEDACKDSTLKCRSGDPCEVNCNGDNSCEGNGIIDGSDSTHVTVNCMGDNACKGNTIINCGTSSCAIVCRTSTSCDGTEVNADTATNLQCRGACGSIPSPFHIPTSYPTIAPTNAPTFLPTIVPTYIPTNDPTLYPTNYPTINPSVNPTNYPTSYPTIIPTINTNIHPTNNPTHNSILATFTSNIVSDIESKLRDDANTLDYTKSGMSTNSIYRLFIAGTVLIVVSSVLCCFGVCVYYSAKKTNVAEGINDAVDQLSSSQAQLSSFNYTVSDNGTQHKVTNHENDTTDDDAKMDELINDGTNNGDNEPDSSLTSCSVSANIGDTSRKLHEHNNGKQNIKIMDPQMYTWYSYNDAHGVYVPQLPPNFNRKKRNNAIST